MTDRLCVTCQREVEDAAYLCARCTEKVERDLAEVESYSAELVTTRLRQGKTGGPAIGVASRSYDKPLPWDPKAAEVADALHATLVGWARVVIEERGVNSPADDDGALARFLLRHLDWLRHHQAADDLQDEVKDAMARARAAVDSRASLAYNGPCRAEYHPDGVPEETACCLAEVYVRSGSAYARCRECGTEHDVSLRQRWLLGQVEDQLVDVPTLSAAVSSLSRPITTAAIRGYVHRGRLVAHGDRDGRAVYRVGDLLDLLHGTERRESA